MLTHTSGRFAVALLALFAVSPLRAQRAAKPLTQETAKELIQRGTQIDGCGDPSYAFTSVQLGTIQKQKTSIGVIPVHPVHAHYMVTCRWGTEQMRAEVDLKLGFYLDSFGAWQATDPGFDGDQTWANTESDVRCRAQNLAHLTLDSNGKVTGSTPAKDQSFGFPACRVVTRASD